MNRETDRLSDVLTEMSAKALVTWMTHSALKGVPREALLVRGNDMVKELNHSIDSFNYFEDILQVISSNTALKYGITDELLNEIQIEMSESIKSDYLVILKLKVETVYDISR
ncbi:TPA: hypothetical protein ACQD71_003277 [Yersinia enterocolitica]